MGGMGRMSPAMMQSHNAMHAFSMAVDMAEIDEAQLAMTNSTNAQVRQFAQRMITEHTAAMQREEQMMARMGMGMMKMGMGMDGRADGNMPMTMDMGRMRTMLMENPHSRPVMEGHMQGMTMLRGMSGMAFDRAYMNRQVAMHRYALENMDRMMSGMGMMNQGTAGSAGMHAGMDASGNMEMKGGRDGLMMMHQTKRAAIASHLEMAQQMMAAMR